MDKEEILTLINKQKESFSSCKLHDINYRKKLLLKLYKNIKLSQQEIFEALKADLNKSVVESYMAEVGLVLSEIKYMLGHIKKFAKPNVVATPLAQFHSKSYKIACPYGQVLIISPWNYPFMLALEPLVDALSAGNVAVIKPSSSSPHVSDVIEKIIDNTFSKEEVFVVKGGREDCDFLLEQDFDYIFYTGSTNVGKTVMQKASEHFTPVTLEMGGKSPCIVDKTADIKLSAKRIVFGKFLNCGQTCVAPDYIYCDESIRDKLVDEIERQIVLQYSVDPILNKDYPRLINIKQFNRVKSYYNENNLIFGGKSDEKLLKIEPTIVFATFDDQVMKEEVFGPVLPIVTFKSLEECVEKIKTLSKPLAFYVFSTSTKNQNFLVNNCDFGGGCINDTIIHIATSNMGFGGLKQSGIGAYHGKTGFETFSHYKSIVDKKRWIDMPMRYQPYSKWKYKLIRMFLK